MTAHTDGDFLEPSLLERYCSGTPSPEDQARIDRWFAEHPGRREWYEQLRAGLREQELSVSVEEQRAAWVETVQGAVKQSPEKARKLFPVLPTEIDATPPVSPRTSNAFGSRSVGRIANQGIPIQREALWKRTAIPLFAILGVAIAVLSWNLGARYGRQGAVSPTMTYATGNGERATIALPGGGTVALNVASRLEVPVDFARGNHTVRLVGEALFTVAHTAGSPFSVVAGSMTARVLGTTFSVRHYPSDSATTVAVQQGRVAVGTTVVPEQRLVVASAHGTSGLQSAPSGAFSFASGTLSLGYMPLANAIPDLDRWFDVDIRLGDPRLATQHFHGDFAAGSISDLKDILELAFAVRVVRDGRVLTLYPGSPK